MPIPLVVLEARRTVLWCDAGAPQALKQKCMEKKEKEQTRRKGQKHREKMGST